jgi:hypothetical protein
MASLLYCLLPSTHMSPLPSHPPGLFIVFIYETCMSCAVHELRAALCLPMSLSLRDTSDTNGVCFVLSVPIFLTRSRQGGGGSEGGYLDDIRQNARNGESH